MCLYFSFVGGEGGSLKSLVFDWTLFYLDVSIAYTYDNLLFFVHSESESVIQKVDTHLNISFRYSI